MFFSGTAILLYSSYNFIGSGLSTTLHFTYPVVVILLSALFFRVKIGRKEIICAALCAAGMLLFYTPDGAANTLGIFLAASSGISYSVYILLLGKSSVHSLPVLTLSFWLSFFASIETAIIAALQGQLTFNLGVQAWAAELMLALLATVLGATLFQKGVLLSGPVLASLLSTFEPLTGVVLGLIFFGEAVTLKILIGIISILSAAVFLGLAQSKEKSTA